MFATACGRVCVAFLRYDRMSKRATLSANRKYFHNQCRRPQLAPSRTFSRALLWVGLCMVLPAFLRHTHSKYFSSSDWLEIQRRILHNQLHNHSLGNLKASLGKQGPHQRELGGQVAVKEKSI